MQSEVVTPLERRLVNAFIGTLWRQDRTGQAWAIPPELPHAPVRIPTVGDLEMAGLWFPHEAPVGTVVLAHPDRRYGKHWFVREGWVAFLHEHGFEVLVFDFPGYGGSPGPASYFHDHVVAAAEFARWYAGGLPVHVVGLSLGAFAVANALPRLPFVRSAVLESPYPSFAAWYGKGPGHLAMRAFERLFPRTARSIDAARSLGRAETPRILVVLAEEDEVTRPILSEQTYAAIRAGQGHLLRVPAARHLQPFAVSTDYRRAILETLRGEAPESPATAPEAVPV